MQASSSFPESSPPLPAASPPPSTGLLEHLCIEVLQEIGNLLSNGDQMNLRAVCRELGVAIDPLFYTFFVLRGDRIRRESGLHMLEKMAAGQLGWCRHAKTIHITPGSKPEAGEDVGPKWYPSDPALPNLLVSALASMHHIQTVVWNANSKDPDWVKEAIRDSLNTFPLLSDLQLKAQGTVNLGLTPIPTLTKLWVEAQDHWPQIQIVQDICQVVGRSHNLTSLHISVNANAGSDWSRIWTMLRTTLLRPNPSAHIHLKDLTTNSITTDLLTYLRSYSGTLETVSLERSHGSASPKPDPLASTFFETVLPAHAKTLVELSCPACHDGRWSFGVHNVDAILPLRQLETLDMTVNAGDVIDIDPPLNAVSLLLSTAALLPALRLLKIAPASYHRDIDSAIKSALENYTTHTNSPLLVCVASSSYMYHAQGGREHGHDWYALAPALSDEGEHSTLLVYKALDPEAAAVKRIRAWYDK
ncbi:hypothetical protein C8F04DRAFT_1047773 [Mycena alexandri]|uniref:F-box domain-containing protein n=1 Tax=Mycena alexandri TaxID=1745969 RepID=A0AAD6WT14_9AGAR|nr:hypothetical protein C8F04DRAFT_1047773 [Mycena alexandri]